MKIYKGDALDQLKKMETESIDCIVTSPPYWQLRDYGVEGQLGLEESLDEFLEKLTNIFEEAYRVLKETGTLFVNLGDTYSNSHGKLVGNTERKGFGIHNGYESIYRKTEVKRKSRLCIPERFVIKMLESGWILRNKIIWRKPNIMPESTDDRFTNDFEELFFFTKNQKYYFKKQYEPYAEKTLKAFKNGIIPASHKYLDQEDLEHRPKSRMRDVKKEWLAVKSEKGRNMRAVWEELFTLEDIKNMLLESIVEDTGDIWNIATIGFKGKHFATYPEELVRRCLSAGCPENGVVLDMFLGTGTTLKVAKDMGLDGVGIEIKEEYIEIAVERIGNSLFNKLEVL